MNRAILIWAVSCGLILSVLSKGPCEEPAKAKQGDLIVLFIKVVEESADKRQSQIVSEPMLVAQLGEPRSFLVGAGVPNGDSYLDVGQRYDFKPTKINGQTIWIVIESTFTDYVKDEHGELKPFERRQVTKRKLELGKVVVDDPWKWNLVSKAKAQLHIEYRVERMTEKEYEIADAKAREAVKKE